MARRSQERDVQSPPQLDKRWEPTTAKEQCARTACNRIGLAEINPMAEKRQERDPDAMDIDVVETNEAKTRSKTFRQNHP